MTELAHNLTSDPSPQEIEFDIPEELFLQGCVYVIDLFSVRVSSGVLWDRTRENISARLSSILQRLAPQATQSLTGPSLTRCIVTIPDITPDKGIAICVRAAYELAMGLLGRCEISDIHVIRASRGPSGNLLPKRLGIEELLAITERLKLADLIIPRQLISNRPRMADAEAKGDAVASLGGKPITPATKNGSKLSPYSAGCARP